MAITQLGLHGGPRWSGVIDDKPGQASDFGREAELRIRTTRLGRMRIERTRKATIKTERNG